MTRFILRRLLALGPVLLVVLSLVFLLTFLIPGDAALYIAGFNASPEQIEALRQQMGLSDPFWVQYLRYIGGVLRGDLGTSVYTRQPVMTVVLDNLPNSLLLSLAAIALSVAIGVPAGVLSAYKRGSWLDFALSVVLAFGYSVPGFWLGLMLILVFALTLGWLPPTGFVGVQYLILPALALAASSAAMIARMTRSSVLEVLSHDYIRTARGKGVREASVLGRHALRNSLIPVATIVGLEFSKLVGRSVVIETVFAWPGLGRLLLNAITARDIPLVEGIVLVYAVTVVLVNLLVDLSYVWLDPRMKHA